MVLRTFLDTTIKMEISEFIKNKTFQLIIPHIELDNLEIDPNDEYSTPITTFELTSSQWTGLLGLWYALNDEFDLLLDMCEEDWLYAKDVDKALVLVEHYRNDKYRDVEQSDEEYQHSLDIVKAALLEAKKYNTYVEFAF